MLRTKQKKKRGYFMNKIQKCLVVSGLVCLSGCGEIVEQNQLALVLHSLGNRDVKTANKGAQDVVNGNYSADLITATRAPVQTPGTTVLIFPLGLQAYMFEAEKTVESPDNEELVCDATGGRVTFDVTVHTYIDGALPDIKDRLMKLMSSYRLVQYSGTGDVLKELIHGRFKNVLREPFVDYCAGKSALEIMRNRSALNALAKKHMNDKFNALGLRFPLVSVSSSFRVPPEQQVKMNEIYGREIDNQVLEIQNLKIKPIEADIARLKQTAITDSEQVKNTAKSESILGITKAQKHRKEVFVKLVGADKYVQFETVHNMVEALEKGRTTLTVVPSGSQIFFSTGGGAAAIPVVSTATPEVR
jgi:regulator of protease activity HflC (stomatin/prohibitin superfamily)